MGLNVYNYDCLMELNCKCSFHELLIKWNPNDALFLLSKSTNVKPLTRPDVWKPRVIKMGEGWPIQFHRAMAVERFVKAQHVVIVLTRTPTHAHRNKGVSSPLAWGRVQPMSASKLENVDRRGSAEFICCSESSGTYLLSGQKRLKCVTDWHDLPDWSIIKDKFA